MQEGEAPEGAGQAGTLPASSREAALRRHTSQVLAAGFGFGVLACVVAWFSTDTPTDAWSSAARLTAQVSALLFLGAFSASALARLWPAPATLWLLRERRGMGLGFCAAHGVHLIAVIGRSVTGEVPGAVAIVGGGLAYLWLAAMALTSNDRAVARIGARRWRRLHTWGMHYLWTIFAVGYLSRVVRQDVPLVHALLFTLFLYVMLLRIYQRLHPAR